VLTLTLVLPLPSPCKPATACHGLPRPATTLLPLPVATRVSLLPNCQRWYLPKIHDFHEVDKPGNSFYGWALALSGLPPATRDYRQVRLQDFGCKNVGAASATFSVWQLPAEERGGNFSAGV